MTNSEISKFLIRIILNPLFLILPQIVFSVPINRNRAWVFWYYSNDGQSRGCGNYCILTFAIVAAIILILILCGCWSCYRIKRNAKKEGRTYSLSQSFRTQSFRELIGNKENKESKESKNKHGRSDTSGSMSEVLHTRN
jgi:hypothetical protein